MIVHCCLLARETAEMYLGDATDEGRATSLKLGPAVNFRIIPGELRGSQMPFCVGFSCSLLCVHAEYEMLKERMGFKLL